MYEETITGLRKIVQEYKGRLTPYMRLTICKAADAIEELSKLADAIPHIRECCVGCEMEKPGGSCPHGFIFSAKRTQEYIAGMQKKYDEVLKAAKQMHTWIFLNSGDEQAAYDECGLTDEMNAAFGYGGQYIVEPPKEEA